MRRSLTPRRIEGDGQREHAMANRATTEPSLPTESLRVKYRSRNPIVRRIMHGFLRDLDHLVDGIAARTILEVGCGEGFLTDRLQARRRQALVVGVDDSAEILAIAAANFARTRLVRGSAYRLPCADGAFDLVVACEVLEHLAEPERALEEIRRVASAHVILSVPNEPIWRLLNLARGKYVADLGNTPGHLQHWRPAAFVKLVERSMDVIAVRRPFPWTMVAARVPRAAAAARDQEES